MGGGGDVRVYNTGFNAVMTDLMIDILFNIMVVVRQHPNVI